MSDTRIFNAGDTHNPTEVAIRAHAPGPYTSTKTYGTITGLSCCFRQWRASSHCCKNHGYALGFRFTFGAYALDDRGWVQDFGGLKGLKAALEANFDHVQAVAADDPAIPAFLALQAAGAANVVVFLNGVGTEMFAKKAFDLATQVLDGLPDAGRTWVISAECFEHEGNSSIYTCPLPR